ncbi:MAG: hypothetical protein MUC50_05115 [Myxococcota bacterium]|jgi:hypothetical protein|nr:hypothetical protein [Myxococcota bacterium]
MHHKLIAFCAIMSLLIASVAFTDVPINKKHLGKTGLDGQKVNCAYCHDAKKANNPKTKGNDLSTLKKGKYCAMKDCH